MKPATHDWYTKNENGRQDFVWKIRRFLKIFKHPSDVWLMVRISSWALVLPVLKRLVPLKSLTNMMWVQAKAPRMHQQEEKITTLVRWLYTYVFPQNTCLERSLILYRFLSRNNSEPQLVTGMRQTEDRIWKGHAWIVVDGSPLDESVASVQDFEAFAIFGRDGTMLKVDTKP